MRARIWGMAAAAVLGLALAAGGPVHGGLIDEYPSMDQMSGEVRDLAAGHPDRIEVIEYGRSVEGRPLVALRFHRGDGAARPGGMVAGNIHGEEWIGNRAAMAVARRVAQGLDGDEEIAAMLERMDIYILPCLNPDGYYATWVSHGDTSFGSMRKNARGVDLNRNFPPPGGEKMERDDPASEVYAGPAPLSEPETMAVVSFALTHNVFATVDYHSVTGVFGTPTCYSLECVGRYEKMCWAHFRNQKTIHYPWMVLPGVAGREWYPGQMEPYLYHEHGIMGILIELGIQPVNMIQNRSTQTFETFNPKDPDFWADNEAEAALHALDAAYRATGGRPVPKGER